MRFFRSSVVPAAALAVVTALSPLALSPSLLAPANAAPAVAAAAVPAVQTAPRVPEAPVHAAQAPALPAGWSGKQHACWHLAKLARYPLLVFVDADVRLAPDGLARMAAFMAKHPAAGLASGFPRQETGTWPERLVSGRTDMKKIGRAHV